MLSNQGNSESISKMDVSDLRTKSLHSSSGTKWTHVKLQLPLVALAMEELNTHQREDWRGR